VLSKDYRDIVEQLDAHGVELPAIDLVP